MKMLIKINKQKQGRKQYPKISYLTISVANVTLKITYTHPDTVKKICFCTSF